MAGQSPATGALTVSNALQAACVTVFADPKVWVGVGTPGGAFPNDVVSFQQITTVQDPATQGPQRTRNEHLTIKVVFSVYRKGSHVQDAQVQTRAYALLALLETYCRKTDPTLGGVCNWCFLTSTDGDPETDPMIVAEGRLYELTAIFSAFVRITG